jgi:hypothetical protein
MTSSVLEHATFCIVLLAITLPRSTYIYWYGTLRMESDVSIPDELKYCVLLASRIREVITLVPYGP